MNQRVLDMFRLPVDGDENDQRWVAWAGNGTYQVGEFDGKGFKATSPDQRHYFGNAYAGQTFSNARGGRRVHIAWLNMDREGIDSGHAGMPFNQQLTLPIEFTLHKTDGDGVRLAINPIEELSSLRSATQSQSDLALSSTPTPLSTGKQVEIDAISKVDGTNSGKVTFTIRGRQVSYDFNSHQLNCNGVTGAITPTNGRLRLRIFLDRTSLEVFAGDGELYLSSFQVFTPGDKRIDVSGDGTVVETVDVHQLRSIWRGDNAAIR